MKPSIKQNLSNSKKTNKRTAKTRNNAPNAAFGTALKIAEVVGEARNTNSSQINIKSFREEGEVGIHKTIFKSSDDEIIIYHNAYNRAIFRHLADPTAQRRVLAARRRRADA